jgi:hypothetical protein
LQEPTGRVWALWVAGYAVGGTVGSLLENAVTSLFASNGTAGTGLSTPLPDVLAAFAGTFVFGVVLGLGTWLALFRYLKNAALWPILTGVGLALGTALVSMTFPLIFPDSTGGATGDPVSLLRDAANGAVVGLGIGLAQATLLARRVSDSAGIVTFVLTSGLGWVGLVLLDTLLVSITSGVSSGAGPIVQISILLVGFALAGLMSGYEIPSLLKKHQQQLLEENRPDATTPAARAH